LRIIQMKTESFLPGHDPRGAKAPLGTYPFPHRWNPENTPWRPEQLLQKITEEEIQITTILQLRALSCWVKRVDVGAKIIRGRAIGALAKAGVPKKDAAIALRPTHAGAPTDADPGFSDLHGIIGRGPFRGRPFYLECKRPPHYSPSESKLGRMVIESRAGELTDDQLRFLLEARAMGAIVGVFWHPQEALKLLGLTS
jgi:hypothetical protein